MEYINQKGTQYWSLSIPQFDGIIFGLIRAQIILGQKVCLLLILKIMNMLNATPIILKSYQAVETVNSMICVCKITHRRKYLVSCYVFAGIFRVLLGSYLGGGGQIQLSISHLTFLWPHRVEEISTKDILEGFFALRTRRRGDFTFCSCFDWWVKRASQQ